MYKFISVFGGKGTAVCEFSFYDFLSKTFDFLTPPLEK